MQKVKFWAIKNQYIILDCVISFLKGSFVGLASVLLVLGLLRKFGVC